MLNKLFAANHPSRREPQGQLTWSWGWNNGMLELRPTDKTTSKNTVIPIDYRISETFN